MLHFRIFSKKHNLYTNSPSWPSNQRSVSDWFLAPNGDIIEAIDFGGLEFTHEHHDPRDFAIEVWTGYLDSKGKKIYRGDIIQLSCFTLDYEVVWSYDRFKMEALDKLATKVGDDNLYPWRTPVDMATNYEIIGNIHSVEFSNANSF